MSWKSAFKSNQKFSVINLLIDENGFIELENLAILFATTLLLATLIVGCGLSLPPILKLGMILASPCLFMAGMFNAAAHRANNDNLWVHVNINSAIIMHRIKMFLQALIGLDSHEVHENKPYTTQSLLKELANALRLLTPRGSFLGLGEEVTLENVIIDRKGFLKINNLLCLPGLAILLTGLSDYTFKGLSLCVMAGIYNIIKHDAMEDDMAVKVAKLNNKPGTSDLTKLVNTASLASPNGKSVSSIFDGSEKSRLTKLMENIGECRRLC